MRPGRSVTTAALILVCAGPIAARPVRADEAKVPDAVQSAARQILGKDAHFEAAGNTGAAVYEASGNSEVEVVLGSDGALRETHVDVPVESLPESVARTLRANAAKDAVLEAEVMLTPDAVRFVVEAADAQGRGFEYAIDPQGNLLGTTALKAGGSGRDEDAD